MISGSGGQGPAPNVVHRGVTALRRGTRAPQRFLGWLFDRIWVRGGRYGCYNQQPYLAQYGTARARSTGFDWTLFQVMLSDRARIEAYRRDIEASVSGRSVLEVGPGPAAVLTRLALDAGAARVISIEGNPWVAEAASTRLRRSGFPDSRATVVAAFSDDIGPEHTDDVTHFDVLLLESYHAIASQERVVETVANLRAHGFTFDRVISKGFTTYVAPARAPRSRDLSIIERALMGWPTDPDAADDAMRSLPSSLHGDVSVIESLCLAPGQVWQSCDLESGDPASTNGTLEFEVEAPGEYTGLAFWNTFHFHDDQILDTLATPTSWGVFFVPLPLETRVISGPARLTLSTRGLRPDAPSAVTLRMSADGRRSAEVSL